LGAAPVSRLAELWRRFHNAVLIATAAIVIAAAALWLWLPGFVARRLERLEIVIAPDPLATPRPGATGSRADFAVR